MTGELLQRLFEEGERLDAGRDFWVHPGAILADAISRLIICDQDDAARHECERVCREHANETDKITAAVERGLVKCESPIEAILLPWLVGQTYSFLFDYNPKVLFAGEGDQLGENSLAVIPQLPIGRFRVDFAVAMRRQGPVCFVMVECDGADFHDNPDQVIRDVNRDVRILSHPRVCEIVRLTGREITAEPRDAAAKVVDAVRRAWRVRH